MTAATYAQSAVVGEDHGPRLGERGAAWQQCLVSAALFVPIVAWWPMSLWLYQFDPHHGESGPARVAAFNASLDTLRAQGATIVDPADLPDSAELLASNNESIVLGTDFKVRRYERCCGETLKLMWMDYGR